MMTIMKACPRCTGAYYKDKYKIKCDYCGEILVLVVGTDFGFKQNEISSKKRKET